MVNLRAMVNIYIKMEIIMKVIFLVVILVVKEDYIMQMKL